MHAFHHRKVLKAVFGAIANVITISLDLFERISSCTNELKNPVCWVSTLSSTAQLPSKYAHIPSNLICSPGAGYLHSNRCKISP